MDLILKLSFLQEVMKDVVETKMDLVKYEQDLGAETGLDTFALP